MESAVAAGCASAKNSPAAATDIVQSVVVARSIVFLPARQLLSERLLNLRH
jgi:hypothetical protein